VEDIIEKLEKQEKYMKIINLLIVVLYIYMTVSMFCTLTGLKLSTLLHKVVQHKYRLPPNWVQKYSYELYLMRWALFILMLVDLPVYIMTKDEEGKPQVPLPYLVAVSAVFAVCGFVLFMAYGYAFDFMYFLFGVLSLYNCARKGKRKEVSEEPETDLFEDVS